MKVLWRKWMKSGIWRNKAKKNKNLILKIYWGFGALFLVGSIFYYTNRIADQLKKEAETIPNLFSQFVKLSTEDDFNSLFQQYLLEDVIAKIDYPIIVTDEKMYPQYWKNVDVPEAIRFDDLKKEQQSILNNHLAKMKDKNWVIPLKYKRRDEKIIGYTFYSESLTLRLIRQMPYYIFLVTIAFGLFGFYGFVIIKKSEKNQIWVGLAKETAHQFGTPITSLLGWISVLKSKFDPTFDSDTIMMLDYMETDILQLKKVASRFGKVGSTIKLVPTDLHGLLDEIIQYFQKRSPSLSNQITFHFISKIQSVLVELDTELISWTIENVLKNSIDAMQGKSGNIIVTAFSKNDLTTILIQDEGKGMSKSMFTKIFEPGITTKKRGWGLGLSLAKRIVEEYHNGRIKVLKSTINEGTTFEISIPNKVK
jgi:hypothetical protein